jgi:hypothetical protein
MELNFCIKTVYTKAGKYGAKQGLWMAERQVVVKGGFTTTKPCSGSSN